ncbi:uncharacterized protein LOC134353517 [Mobula hypostoma]|uniref:uncharacterized protein LOC134353517 n=1 Tax=Mobula hypostoma TaxID=723540 RepID=UPI002FC2907A
MTVTTPTVKEVVRSRLVSADKSLLGHLQCLDRQTHGFQRVQQSVSVTQTSRGRLLHHLAECCHNNNLSLNVNKTKKLIPAFSRGRPEVHEPVIIRGSEEERVSNFKFLGASISEELSWTHHINIIAKKARQHLYFLRSLQRFGMPSKTLANFCKHKIICRCRRQSNTHNTLEELSRSGSICGNDQSTFRAGTLRQTSVGVWWKVC